MTRIRPCIDLHEGKVKQIVGSSLKTTATTADADGKGGNSDEGDGKEEQSTTAAVTVNFSSDRPASYFSKLYKDDGLTGGHIIMLGRNDANANAARDALQAWKSDDDGGGDGGWQIGGGMTADNCREWIDAGASRIIVTSYVFHQGAVDYDRLERLVQAIGKDKLVLDLSCRRKKKNAKSSSVNGNDGDEQQQQHDEEEEQYYVVTNKWQTFTDTAVTPATLEKLAKYCSEFLVHAVDVEGKQSGILPDLVEFLGLHSPIPVTYAGGVRSLDDLDLVDRLGRGKVDVTVGSALDIFGGPLPYKDVVRWHSHRNK